MDKNDVTSVTGSKRMWAMCLARVSGDAMEKLGNFICYGGFWFLNKKDVWSTERIAHSAALAPIPE